MKRQALVRGFGIPPVIILAIAVLGIRPVHAQSIFTTITYFGSGSGPQNPVGALVEGSDGSIYGVTEQGGAFSRGTVYKVDRASGDSVVLKSFTGTNGDGCQPSAGVIQATNGALYGTTMYDTIRQSGSSTFVEGYGGVFTLNTDGSGYQVLKKFTGTPDTANPYGSLFQASNGALYGSTMNGGSQSRGTVFTLQPDGSAYTIIKNFQDIGATDGAAPYAGVIQGADGALYGTTSVGGTASQQGTVFKLNLDGSGYTVLKRFTGADGSSPWGPLLQGRDGALYGTTATGGASNKGTVFKINPDGSGFALLKSFAGRDGDGPVMGSLAQAPNGILYGTTASGGAATLMQSFGTVFQLQPDGTGFYVLKTFPQLQQGNGVQPRSGLHLGSDGTLYGSTESGAGGGPFGTVFSLVPAPVLLVSAPAGPCRLRFLALPGRSYTLQRAASPDGPWTAVGTAAVASTGVGELLDTNPPSGSAFYRTCYP